MMREILYSRERFMAEQQLRENRQIGHYSLVRLLGQGGFAEVYLGEHVHLKTPAAVKVLHSRLMDEDVQQFKREAQTVARLLHPNIVRVLDFGVENSIPYLVMDYAPNGTLRNRYPRGSRIPLSTVVALTRQIADALQYAHEQRLIHRDIKPENLLLGRNSEVLLSDFGIALVLQSSRLYSPQNIAGTIIYMAPEQIQAHPTPASDQYSLAIVVYEWLCGVPPFQGSYTEIAVKQTMTAPQPLRSLVPDISYEVEQIVMTALQKDPARRFPTILAFAHALEQAARTTSQSFASTFIKSPSLPLQPAQQGPTNSSAYAAKFATDMKPSSVSQSQYNTPSTGQPVQQIPGQWQYPMSYPPQSFVLHNTPYPAQETKRGSLSRRTFLVGGGMAGAAVLGGAAVWSFLSTRTAVPTILTKTLTTHSGNILNTQADSPLLTLTGHTAFVLHVRWSPDGALIASGSSDGTSLLWTANDGKQRLSLRSTLKPPMTDDYPWSIDWSSRKGVQHLAVAFVYGTVQVVDVSNGQRLSSLDQPLSRVPVLSWSPDERYIVLGGSDNILHVYAYPSWHEVTTYQEHTNIIKAVAWSPDGNSIASGSEDTTVRIWTPLTGKTKLICSGHTDAVATVAWSYDSKKLVSTANDKTARTWDIASGRTLQTYKEPGGAPIGEAQWSHSNRLLAIYGGDGIVYILDAQTLQVKQTITAGVTYSQSWSPDDTRLATANYDNVVRIWQVNTKL